MMVYCFCFVQVFDCVCMDAHLRATSNVYMHMCRNQAKVFVVVVVLSCRRRRDDDTSKSSLFIPLRVEQYSSRRRRRRRRRMEKNEK